MTHPLERAVKAYDVRGVVGEDLDEAAFDALGEAFVRTGVAGPAPTRVVVGHDMRPSSPDLAEAFARGAARAGAHVELLGLTATDQLYLASGLRDAGGAMVTASHNPARYNGLKLCRPGARAVSLDDGLAEVRDAALATLAGAAPGPAAAQGEVVRRDSLAEYAAHLRGLVDLSAGRPLRVVVDAGNGMAGLTVPAVLGTVAGLPALPVDLVPLYWELDGSFPNHEANPLDVSTLTDLQAAVVAEGADAGLAFDGDADRCVLVDETGRVVDASAVTALVARTEVARARASGEAEPVVLHNLITSRVVPEVVSAAGGRSVRTRVGHSYIKAEMARTGAVFGGEHSAHYYFRDFYGADSGMLAALHVLAALGRSPAGTTLSSLVADYAPYARSGEVNSTVGDAAAATARAVAAAEAWGEPVDVDRLDGTTVSAGDGSWWFNLRPSNTEPLLRLNVEAGDEATMTRVRDDVLAVVRTDPQVDPEEEPVSASTSAAPEGAGDRPLVEPWLREVLRCPACRSTLADGTGDDGQPRLRCTQDAPDPGDGAEALDRPAACGRSYPFDRGVPVLLVDEGVLPSAG
ncbi:phosphomannomutase/phosphoglucomutase [Aquipuribacter nitratireducens]|uniref:Phosphomannomutase/phosphoglucomutase n=1 Tax=Aquipuribacter nitratireducens TaxID=650104 RepID=A0ABW0GKP5_9MICO